MNERVYDYKSYRLAKWYLPDDASEEQKRELACRLLETAKSYISELITSAPAR